MTLNGMVLNEKQVFALLEQSFLGERPNVESVKMGFRDRVDVGFELWAAAIVLVVLVCYWIFGG